MVKSARREAQRRLASVSSPARHETGWTLTPQQNAAIRFMAVQQHIGNQAAQRLLRSGVIQDKLRISEPREHSEHEAYRVAEAVTQSGKVDARRKLFIREQIPGPHIQRKCVECEEEEEILQAKEISSWAGEGPSSLLAPDEPIPTPAPAVTEPTPATAPPTEVTPTPTPAEPSPEAAIATEPPAAGWIVEDSVQGLGPGQMRKTEFLAQLRTEVCSAAEDALAGTGRSTRDCPYLDYWFGYYSGQDSRHIERAVRRYTPEAVGATTAGDVISLISERVRRAVEVWATTGRIIGVPEVIPMGVPGAAPPETAGSSVPVGGEVLFKARPGGARNADDPQAMQAQLGLGRPLDSRVRSRMESAFGYSFSHVRVHTDAEAAELSRGLNARAFTVGEHVAFGASEYQPGTLIGDALIAHELAHVLQQAGAVSSATALRKGGAGYGALEEDADTSAVGAVVSLWSRVKGLMSDISQNALPRLKSGLGLQRCPSTTAVPRLRKRTVSGPTPGDCDAYSWGSQWYLDNPGSSNGWIVQKVQDIFDVTDCSAPSGNSISNADIKTRTGGLDPSIFPYWEAWQVRSGTVYVGDSTTPHSADTYGLGGISGDSRGRERIIGDAEFYLNLTLPSSFSVRVGHPAQSLPVATSQPTLMGGTGSLAHNLTANWNCCPGSSTRLTTLTTT